MKLIYRITWRLAPILTLVMLAWAAFFYFALLNEVNDEMDDSLEDYSENIIRRALAGEPLPSLDNGSNNQYYLREVSKEYADSHEKIRFTDKRVYIREKNEYEPARVLTNIFRMDDGRMMELTVSLPTIEKKDLREAICIWIVFLYVVLLFVVLFVNLFVFNRNMRPLYKLLDWIDKYRLGKPDNKPLDNKTNVTEFKKLNSAIMQHAARNEELFEQQKQFIGNASHELQTPLAICSNRIEMLLEDESLKEEQIGVLIKIHAKLENMSRLNRSLLLLCKIDNNQFVSERAVNWNVILDNYLGDFKEVYSSQNIKVEVEQSGIFKMNMNETLATTLLANLLKNSFAHNVQGGLIHIIITQNSFIIKNSGVEEPLDEKKIFTRFYHSGGKKDSSGLGLSIVKAICQRYGFSIKYYFEEGLHVFEINKK